MCSLPLPGPESSLQFTLRGEGLGPLGRFAVVAAAAAGCLLPIILVLWLYFYEARLVSRAMALGLLSLRLAALVVLLFLLFLQRVYGHDVTYGLPGRVVVAVARSDSMAAADPQRPAAETR